MGTLAVLQFIYIMIRRPKLLPKTLKVIPFFFFVYLIFELIAMYLVQWTFPGQYIGSVSFGGLSFPIEELLFWVIISSGVGVSYHELFVDDGK
jgi:ACR3 family arsenite efflux pump ArsB